MLLLVVLVRVVVVAVASLKVNDKLVTLVKTAVQPPQAESTDDDRRNPKQGNDLREHSFEQRIDNATVNEINTE